MVRPSSSSTRTRGQWWGARSQRDRARVSGGARGQRGARGLGGVRTSQPAWSSWLRWRLDRYATALADVLLLGTASQDLADGPMDPALLHHPAGVEWCVTAEIGAQSEVEDEGSLNISPTFSLLQTKINKIIGATCLSKQPRIYGVFGQILRLTVCASQLCVFLVFLSKFALSIISCDTSIPSCYKYIEQARWVLHKATVCTRRVNAYPH